MNVFWKVFVVTSRLICYPILTGLGLFLAGFLAALYLAFFFPWLGVNLFALFCSAISNDPEHRNHVVVDSIETVKDCFHVVTGFFLSPVSVAVWALSTKRKKKIYWLSADEKRHAGDAESFP